MIRRRAWTRRPRSIVARATAASELITQTRTARRRPREALYEDDPPGPGHRRDDGRRRAGAVATVWKGGGEARRLLSPENRDEVALSDRHRRRAEDVGLPARSPGSRRTARPDWNSTSTRRSWPPSIILANDHGVFRVEMSRACRSSRRSASSSTRRSRPGVGLGDDDRGRPGSQRCTVARASGASRGAHAGKYQAIPCTIVVTAGQDKYTNVFWFAEGVGIVKQRSEIGDVTVVMELMKYEPPNDGCRSPPRCDRSDALDDPIDLLVGGIAGTADADHALISSPRRRATVLA